MKQIKFLRLKAEQKTNDILLADTDNKGKNMIEIHDHISSSFNNELSILDDSLIEMEVI